MSGPRRWPDAFRNVDGVSDLESFSVGSITLGGNAPLFLIAGPCVIESEAHATSIALRLGEACRVLGVPLIFKASYDKANRTSLSSYRGPGLKEGLRILGAIAERTGLPILTDIHEPRTLRRQQRFAMYCKSPRFSAAKRTCS